MRRLRMSPPRALAVILTWVVLLGAAAALLAGVVVPRLAGATTYTVLSGSMSPELEPGDLVVVREVPVDEVGLGSTVTYQLRSGEAQTVTHRVVGLSWSPDGGRLLTTQGDANSRPDVEPVRPEQVRGEVWYSVPWVGHVSSWATPTQRTAALRVAALGLFAYALSTLVVAARRRRQRPAGESPRVAGEPTEEERIGVVAAGRHG